MTSEWLWCKSSSLKSGTLTFGKGATHKLKPKSLQSLTPSSDLATLMLDSKPLVSVHNILPDTFMYIWTRVGVKGWEVLFVWIKFWDRLGWYLHVVLQCTLLIIQWDEWFQHGWSFVSRCVPEPAEFFSTFSCEFRFKDVSMDRSSCSGGLCVKSIFYIFGHWGTIADDSQVL